MMGGVWEMRWGGSKWGGGVVAMLQPHRTAAMGRSPPPI